MLWWLKPTVNSQRVAELQLACRKCLPVCLVESAYAQRWCLVSGAVSRIFVRCKASPQLTGTCNIPVSFKHPEKYVNYLENFTLAPSKNTAKVLRSWDSTPLCQLIRNIEDWLEWAVESLALNLPDDLCPGHGKDREHHDLASWKFPSAARDTWRPLKRAWIWLLEDYPNCLPIKPGRELKAD